MFISIFIIVIKLIIPNFHRHFSNGFDFPLVPKGINITISKNDNILEGQVNK